jgi:hypothetical protein
MKKNKFFRFFIFVFLLLSIKNHVLCQSVNDSSNIRKTITSFLEWHYKVRRNGLDTAIVKGTEGDSLHPYRIDFKESKKYLQFLQSSNFLSDKFINSLYQYLVRCDSNFVKHRQYEWVPFGFDVDIITRDFDDEIIIENVKNCRITKLKRNKNTAFVEVEFITHYKYQFELTNYNGKWLIDKINEGYPKEIYHILPFPSS